METFLEVGVLNYFSIIFPVLLIWVLVYMILEKTKILGESKSLHAILAIAAAFIAMLSSDIISIINFGAPWFVLVFVFLTLLLLIYRFMGASEADLANVIRTDKVIQWAIFAIGIIIVIASISHIYGQRLLEQAPGEEEGVTIKDVREREAAEGRTYRSEVMQAIFSPQILGLLFLFLVATFTIALLSRESI
jgi:heme/copper-type cytochrome/quinol oxidase subunit 2